MIDRLHSCARLIVSSQRASHYNTVVDDCSLQEGAQCPAELKRVRFDGPLEEPGSQSRGKQRYRWWRSAIVKMYLSVQHATQIGLMIEVLGEAAYYQCFATPKKWLPKKGKPRKSGPVQEDENLPKVPWDKTAGTWTVLGEQLRRNKARDWQHEPEDCQHPTHVWKLGGNSAVQNSTKGK